MRREPSDEARHLVDPSRLEYLVGGRPPSLADLSSFDNTQVYDVGYVIGEFVVQRWGQPALPALIRARGDSNVARLRPHFAPDFGAAAFADVSSLAGLPSRSSPEGSEGW